MVDRKILEDEVQKENKGYELLIEPLINKLVSGVTFFDPNPNHLGPGISKEEQAKSMQNVLREIFYKEKERLRAKIGASLIMENLDNISGAQKIREQLKIAAEKYIEDLKKGVSALKGCDEKALGQILLGGLAHENGEENIHNEENDEEIADFINDIYIPAYENLGLNSDDFEGFYSIGAHFFEQKRYDDAGCVFQYLSLLDALCHEVWISLGLCHMETKDWLSALSSFYIAAITNSSNPLSFLYQAQVNIELRDMENAEESLIMAKEIIKQQQPSQEIQDYINEIESQM